MLAKGWIKPSVSLYSSPIFFIPKKTSKLWVCIEFSALNAIIKLHSYPIPCIADFLGNLGKAKCFSSIELATAYH